MLYGKVLNYIQPHMYVGRRTDLLSLNSEYTKITTQEIVLKTQVLVKMEIVNAQVKCIRYFQKSLNTFLSLTDELLYVGNKQLFKELFLPYDSFTRSHTNIYTNVREILNLRM